VLFEPGTFNVQSRHHNLIAFSLDVGLLLRVLRSASGNHAERVEAKLVQKPVRVPGSDEPEQRPFMTFTARVRRVHVRKLRMPRRVH
jgi:HUS1 checkpoint protein